MKKRNTTQTPYPVKDKKDTNQPITNTIVTEKLTNKAKTKQSSSLKFIKTKNKRNKYPPTERSRLKKWQDMIKQYEGKEKDNPTTFIEDLKTLKKQRKPAYYSEKATTEYNIEDMTNRPTINNIEHRKQE